MRYVLKTGAALFIVVLLGAAGMAAVAGAQAYTVVTPGGRGGTWEFHLPLIYSDSATIKGSGGSSVNVDADWGFGFGVGYNLNDHFQLNGMWNWGYRTYEATTVNTDGTLRRYNNNLDTSTLSLNGVYYFLDGKITPFVTGGIGWTYWDTNIPTGRGSTSCWWDPWYGYVCSDWTPTKTESDWSYTAGLGIRFDVNRQFSMQASYNKMWITMTRVSGRPDFDNWVLDLIFRMW